ncbi:MAG: hypothetical protein NZ774_05705 [Candidatus Poseidoniales archaeon]|nr:hypothetical protein [Candidatus Poseidoniales archaeon]
MLEMGLATCCVLCDAPDEAGSNRCRQCIATHKGVRERVSELPAQSLVSQWSKELFQMLARPSSYEHDETHGEWMTAYAQLLHGQSKKPRATTQEDVEAAFEAARQKKKMNTLREMANQSKWKDSDPTEKELHDLSQELPTDIVDKSGIRTVPSKEITQVDRSERPGEDHELTARVQASASNQDTPDDLKDLMVDLKVGEKRAEKKQWKDIVDDVEDLFD